VFIGGTLRKDDGRPGVKLFELEDNAIVYLNRVRGLIESVDSEKLREDYLEYEKNWGKTVPTTIEELRSEVERLQKRATGLQNVLVKVLLEKLKDCQVEKAELSEEVIRLNTTVKVERKGE